MTEEEIRGFIDVVTNYFTEVSGLDATMGMPFIKGNSSGLDDYTGLIGISGNRKGGIYLTAGESLLRDFTSCVLGQSYDGGDEGLLDMVGEMTNTIAGNIRMLFGSDFLISVPMIVKGKIDDIVLKLRKPVYVIPIEWNGSRCSLAVGLE